jgi:ribosome-binding factor A
MSNNVKIDRLNSLFVKEISYILMEEVKDENINNFVTITGAKISSDLSYAKIYFMVLNGQVEETLKALNNAASFIRGKLSERIEIRHTPELTFVYDESIDYGNRIEEILEELKEEHK